MKEESKQTLIVVIQNNSLNRILFKSGKMFENFAISTELVRL